MLGADLRRITLNRIIYIQLHSVVSTCVALLPICRLYLGLCDNAAVTYLHSELYGLYLKPSVDTPRFGL